MTSCAQCGHRLSGEPTCPVCGLEVATEPDRAAEADSTDVEERTPPVSTAEARPEATGSAADDITPEPDIDDEPNESTVIRKPVAATAPEAVDDVPAAEQTSLSLPRISAYGDEDRPGPASSAAAATREDEPTERTSRRPSPDVEERLDNDDEPNGSTAIRPAFAPPTAPPPAAAQAVIPDPSPLPEPAPVPGPDPVPDPEPTPQPVPEPGPVPEPEPVPEPGPAPVPAPDPVSETPETAETAQEPAYQPFVQPSGMLVEQSRNGQARHWAPPEETPAELHDPEPAYATGYIEEGAFATEEVGEWQAGYGYAAEPEPIEQDFGDYGAQQEYVSTLMASESEDNPSTWVVLLWVGSIFMIVVLVLGIWLMTL